MKFAALHLNIHRPTFCIADIYWHAYAHIPQETKAWADTYAQHTRTGTFPYLAEIDRAWQGMARHET